MSQMNKNFLMTTSWDDGHPLDLRVAELLAKFGLTGTFYVPRSGLKEVMSRSEIRDLSQTFEIGAHTLEHVMIDALSESETKVQLSGSREWVEELTGRACHSFCFPGGKFHKHQLRLVRQAGYQSARTVELLSTERPRTIDGLWVIPTTVQVFPHGPYAYARNALKRFSISSVLSPRKIFSPALLLSRDWVALAKVLFTRTMEHGGVFHLWGHSWEIADQRQWQPLENFLAFASAHLRDARCVTNGDLCMGMNAAGYREVSPISSKKGTNPEIERLAASTMEKETS